MRWTLWAFRRGTGRVAPRIEHRVADNRLLRLIQKWLKAGIWEDGAWSETTVGTPQGAVTEESLKDPCFAYCDYCVKGPFAVGC
jgi:hypothetical protein